MPYNTFSALALANFENMTPAERSKWDERASLDKERYEIEMNYSLFGHMCTDAEEALSQQHDSSTQCDNIDTLADAKSEKLTKIGSPKKVGSPKKAITTPKRNLSAYKLYKNAFKEENPGKVDHEHIYSFRIGVSLIFSIVSQERLIHVYPP